METKLENKYVKLPINLRHETTGAIIGEVYVNKERIEVFFAEKPNETVIYAGGQYLTVYLSIDEFKIKMGMKPDTFRPDWRILKLRGMGPKKSRLLFDTYGVRTIEDLNEKFDLIFADSRFNYSMEDFRQNRERFIKPYILPGY